MAAQTDLDELVGHWILLKGQRELITGKRGPARLAFALLLKVCARPGGPRAAGTNCGPGSAWRRPAAVGRALRPDHRLGPSRGRAGADGAGNRATRRARVHGGGVCG